MAALLALAAAVGWGSSDFAAGVASRKSTAVSVVVLTHLASVITLVLVSINLTGVPSMAAGSDLAGVGSGMQVQLSLGALRVLGSPTWVDIAWGVAAGLSGGMGAMFLYRGLARGAMAVVAPITAAFGAVMPAVFGVVMGEPMSQLGAIGLVLALVSIVLVSAAAPEPSPAPDLDLAGTSVLTSRGIVPLPGEVPLRPRSKRFVGRQQLPHTVLPFLALCFVAAPFGGDRVASSSLVSGAWFNGQFLGLVGLAVAIVLVSMRAVTLVSGGPAAGPAFSGGAGPARRSGPALGSLMGPGVLDAVLSGVGFGAFYVLLARAGADAGNWPLVTARSTSVVLFTIAAIATRGPLLPAPGTRRAVVAAGVLDAAAAVLFVAATRSGLLSVSAVLSSMYPGVTVLLARVITKERCSRVQLFGLALAGISIGLIAAF